MTLQSGPAQSGNPISFKQIKNEFGLPPGKNLGAYRVNFSNTQNGGSLSGLPLDDGIPQSGEIKFSDFYGKRMNTVVDCYRGGTQTTASARDKYNNFSRTVVIGEFRSPKSSPSNEKIIVNVNKTFQGPSGSDNRKKCSLRTGVFGNGIIFRIDIGSNGKIVGAGGDGGDGGSIGDGKDGKNGTSGLGLEQKSENGTGKGGGRRRKASGGGGGGGAGLPAGEGGKGGTEGKNGENGGNGGLNSAGSGGEGGNNDNEAVGGEGGHGGRDGQNAEKGERGEGGEGSGSEGGNRGNAGAAIRRSSGSINFSVNGTVRGDTGASGVE
jgi:hypothetical protein